MRSVVPTARDRAWWRYTQALVDFLATSPRNCWLNSYRFCSKSNSNHSRNQGFSPIHGPFALESNALIVLVIASFLESRHVLQAPLFGPTCAANPGGIGQPGSRSHRRPGPVAECRQGGRDPLCALRRPGQRAVWAHRLGQGRRHPGRRLRHRDCPPERIQRRRLAQGLGTRPPHQQALQGRTAGAGRCAAAARLRGRGSVGRNRANEPRPDLAQWLQEPGSRCLAPRPPCLPYLQPHRRNPCVFAP